jgi:spore coat polysaccharide biosynthesis protein SpsF
VEPNRRAREILVADRILRPDRVHAADASALPFPDACFDLVFTCTVLIHVPDDALQAAYREIHRVSRRWILCMEYFSPAPLMIPYRGHDDLLFKRDYGALWLDGFRDLEHVANGFFWKRTTGLDDVNWWLFRKTR